ncbi:hypothetical protein [Winogradskyella sp.]|jgi:hypothetical protein|uniref:hypothetical protein n=1 Tax=Winogradskyella sp. TaxID=1883156 RepID=UPI0025D1AEC1|nr:hypothetical protein [Winogradskyella sp.]MCT4629603.1 hypothetical protein [Winogradskyella sp.]
MREELTWRELEGLYRLYKGKTTRLRLMNNVYVKKVLYEIERVIDYKNGNLKIIEKQDGFDVFFEQKLLDHYLYYASFFEKVGIEISALRKYPEDILKSLILIHKNKEELKDTLSTPHMFSSNFFKEKDSKFLDDNKRLRNDILTILGVDKFPMQSPKSQQWRLVVDCKTPKYVLLCENIDFLKDPWLFRENHIELWYLGGSNTKKLEELPPEKILYPVFYVCDWDYHGLDIYARIKKILKGKGKKIKLIIPKNPMLKPMKSGKHNSEWRKEKFTNLERELFSDEAQDLIELLIKENKWIEEQTIKPIPEIVEFSINSR